MPMTNTPQPGEIYRHHSGTLYGVTSDIIHDGNTGEKMIVYRAMRQNLDYLKGRSSKRLKPTGPRYIHTVANFMQPGRFERVKS